MQKKNALPNDITSEGGKLLQITNLSKPIVLKNKVRTKLCKKEDECLERIKNVVNEDVSTQSE